MGAKLSTQQKEKAARVAGLLLDLYPRLVRRLREGLDPREHGEITLAQCRILSHLYAEPASNKALAEQVGVSVAATSRMVDGLAERGLVERERDEDDKRACRLRLTSAGRRRFLAFRRESEEVLQGPLAELKAAELGEAEAALGRLLDSFRESNELS